jgi:hypothetical protein
VPARIVQHQVKRFAFFGRDFLRHGIEEKLEHLGVAVGDNQADHAAGGGLDGTDNVASEMAAIIL